MTAINEEGPAGEGEAFKNTTHTIQKEKTMSEIQGTPDVLSDSEKLAEWNARSRAERDAWLAEHPELLTATLWHEKVYVEDLDGFEGVEILFERDFGPVRLIQRATHSNGVLTWDDDTTAPNVIVDDRYREELSVEQIRELASALMAAIPVVEEATV